MTPKKSDLLPQLGRRERQIMDAMYRRGQATVAEIRADLPDPPSYSAVRGMLRFLEEKGHLRHQIDGPRYVYYPTTDAKQVRGSAVQHLVRTFFNDSASSAVAAMLGLYEKDLTDEDLDRFEDWIERARKAAGRHGDPESHG